ncbi:MAG: nicotinate (nicotinamide) nucleotide adenylyltransferase [Candidatus Beckwithbacteria bacterium]|nr:nicotinate (nicotinamide) nucleotide adenylyltransferase [Patescibacteria group bacterium]
MNITLFGGSFNPPHLGHQIVINQAFELIPKIDELWLLPDYKHAFEKRKFFIDSKHRLTMTKMLENHKVKTNTCTFDNKMPGNTIFHITYLKEKYPQHQFSFLIGSDNLSTFHKWPKYQTLLKIMPFYIYPRSDYPFKPLYPNMHPLKHPLQIITNISSTVIRNRINKNLSTNHLLPEKIAKYIKKNQLYD